MNEEELLNEVPEHELATISQVLTTGLRLIFDGEEESDGKIYKCNSAVNFKAGERVRVAKIAKTYVVEFPIGNTWSNYPIPSGGTDGQYLVKDGDLPHALKWKSLSISGLLPAGGTTGQFVRKISETDYAVEWATISGLLPAGGTSGQFIRKKSNTAYDVEWATLSGLLPTGGTTGQVLKKSSYSDYAASWATLSGLLPTGGTTGQVLKKSSYSDYSASWGDIPVSGTSLTIGFMGATAYSKQTINSLSSTATLATVITKINDLLTALKNYGLISSY